MGSNISFTPCRAMLLLATIGIVGDNWDCCLPVARKEIGFFRFYSVNSKERPKP